jgi:hypothetical protein
MMKEMLKRRGEKKKKRRERNHANAERDKIEQGREPGTKMLMHYNNYALAAAHSVMASQRT